MLNAINIARDLNGEWVELLERIWTLSNSRVKFFMVSNWVLAKGWWQFHHSTLGSLPPNGCVSNGLDHKNLNLDNSLGLTLETENLSSLVLYSTPNVKSQ